MQTEQRGCLAFITPSAHSRPNIAGLRREMNTGPFSDKQKVFELVGM
jgi:hypothetical protein